MSQPLQIPPPGFESLSIEEKIKYVEALWDHIAARPEDVPVPQWHLEILAERTRKQREGKNEGKTWEEFEQQLTQELNSPPD